MKTGITKYITSLESGGRPKGGGTSDGDIPSLGAEHLNSDGTLNLNNLKYIPFNFYENLSKGRIKKNDILIVKDGATTGKVSYVNGVFPYKDAAINEHVFLLRVDVEKVYPKYLFYHLYSDFGKNQILSDFRGSTVGGISRGFVEYINLPLPHLKTQQEIAQVLEQADKARQQRKAANALTDQFLQSSFLSLFGDPVKNEKAWDKIELKNLISSIDSGWSPVCEENPRTNENQWAVLKLGAVTYCRYNPLENKKMLGGVLPKENIEVKKGDLLFTRKNTKDLVAATAYVFDTPKRLLMSDTIFRLKYIEEKASGIFMWYLFLDNNFRKEVQSLATGSSGSMPNISKEKLMKLLIPLPPLSLQQQFAGIVAEAEQLRQKQRESERELENLFQGLLQRYFG